MSQVEGCSRCTGERLGHCTQLVLNSGEIIHQCGVQDAGLMVGQGCPE